MYLIGARIAVGGSCKKTESETETNDLTMVKAVGNNQPE
jgi:hypothetical protein